LCGEKEEEEGRRKGGGGEQSDFIKHLKSSTKYLADL